MISFKQLLMLVGRFLYAELPSSTRRQGKSASEFTLEEVQRLPNGHPALAGIAQTHTLREVAVAAAMKLTDFDQLRTLFLTQEAQLEARLAIMPLVRHDEKLMLEIAVRGDHRDLEVAAANCVNSRFLVKRLRESKNPLVRLIAISKETDPAALARFLDDDALRVRAEAEAKLKHLQTN